jgi:FkbH-like protein
MSLHQFAGELLKAKNVPGAIELLKNSFAPGDDFKTQVMGAKIAKLICNQDSGFKKFRLAVLGSCTLDHLIDNLRLWLLIQEMNLEENVYPLGTWKQQILQEGSGLYAARPDLIWLFLQPADFNLTFKTFVCMDDVDDVVNGALDELFSAISFLRIRSNSFLMINNLVPPTTCILGNYEGSTHRSLEMAITAFNLGLARRLPRGATIFNVAHLASRLGLRNWEDSRRWYHAKLPFSLTVHGEVGFAAARVISAIKGKARKCIVIDLDNTLWGGVVGDDGVDGIKIGPDGGALGEAYADFQYWLKAMSERGIALAVCSKNHEDVAKEPFLSKSGMILKLTDFAVFKANWENKADNLRLIAKELNIGLDSFVFVDDNPAERALVRAELPEVAVPELSNDPSEFIKILNSGRWFETLALSEEDRSRTSSYRHNISRKEAERSATDIDSFLTSLEMSVCWGEVGGENVQRVAQLINKTNQFQVTLTRYTESEVINMGQTPEFWVGCFSLSDRFGDQGIVSAVVLKFDHQQCVIDTWAMSCRVFSRTLEQFIFNAICGICRSRNVTELIGVFREGQKNNIVSGLYKSFGGCEIPSQENVVKNYMFDLSLRDYRQKTWVIESKGNPLKSKLRKESE